MRAALVPSHRSQNRRRWGEGGEIAVALKLYRTALRDLRRLDDADPRIASVLNNLGQLYDQQGRYRRAIRLYDAATRRASPDTSLGTVTLHNRAAALESLGEHAAAEETWQAVLDAIDSGTVRDRSLAPTVLNSLAVAARRRGDTRAAADLYRRADASACDLLGDDHPMLDSIRGNLSAALADLGDLDGAERIARALTAMNESAKASAFIVAA